MSDSNCGLFMCIFPQQQTTEGPEEGPGEALEGPEEPAAVIGGSVQEDQPRVDIVTDPPVIGRGEVKVNVTSSNATAKPVSTTATQTTTEPTTTRPPTTTTGTTAIHIYILK